MADPTRELTRYSKNQPSPALAAIRFTPEKCAARSDATGGIEPMKRMLNTGRTIAVAFAVFCLTAVFQPALAHAGFEHCSGDLTPSNYDNPIVEFDTNLGSICMELLEDQAPITVANFLTYANRGDYDGIMFHRSVPGVLIQGGGYRRDASDGTFVKSPTDPAILNEPCDVDDPIDTPVRCSVPGNVRGSVAMAKTGGSVNSATSQWFINLVDNSEGAYALDQNNGGFTVFAHVLGDGMDVADAIGALEYLHSTELEYNMFVESAQLFGVFKQVPVIAQPTEGDYGCFDVNELVLLFGPGALTLDPATGVPTSEGFLTYCQNCYFVVFSGACGTLLDDWADFVPPPDQATCPLALNYLGAGVVGNNQTLPLFPYRDGLGNVDNVVVADAVPYNFTCAQANESHVQLNNRRADMGAKIATLAATVETVTVPEPSQPLLALTSLLSLFGLVRLQRRQHQ